MKKILLSLCAVTMLLSGCSKKYNSVSEYTAAMQTVKNAANCYTIEFQQDNSKYKTKSYICKNKWKVEMSATNGEPYANKTLMFDGTDYTIQTYGSNFAVVIPQGDPEEMELLNPAYYIVNWEKLSTSTPTFVNQQDNKNGFDCRTISWSDGSEACISDKYGIAVYAKYNNIFNKSNIINISNINVNDITDSAIQLPNDVHKLDMKQLRSLKFSRLD